MLITLGTLETPQRVNDHQSLAGGSPRTNANILYGTQTKPSFNDFPVTYGNNKCLYSQRFRSPTMHSVSSRSHGAWLS